MYARGPAGELVDTRSEPLSQLPKSETAGEGLGDSSGTGGDLTVALAVEVGDRFLVGDDPLVGRLGFGLTASTEAGGR